MNQRKKMREQWKLIQDLKEQKDRLQNNQPATKPHIVKKLEERTNHKRQIAEDIKQEELDKIETTQDDDNNTERAVSEDSYSDDFEDCSSEAQSIIPRTPELVKKVKEREENRAKRREEIKKMHQTKVEQEKERLKALKEKEIEKEEERRKENREMWKKKRREEIERDKKRLSEKDRQIKLAEVAKKFHRQLLIKQYGFRPWLKLLIHLKVEYSVAQQAYQNKLKRRVLNCWLILARNTRLAKEKEADLFWERSVYVKCWNSWYQVDNYNVHNQFNNCSFC